MTGVRNRGKAAMDVDKQPLLDQVDTGAVLPDKKHGYWTKSQQKQWTLTLICGTSMLYAARTIMPVCITAIADEKHWDKQESGTVLSSFFWGYTLTQFLGGYLSDRVGGERVLMVASSLWATVTFCTPVLIQLSDNKPTALYIIVLARVILGLCQGVHFPGSTSILSRKVPEDRRSLTFSLIATGANCGTLLSGSVGSYLMENFGWQTPFYAIGCGGLVWGMVVYSCLIRPERRLTLETRQMTAPLDYKPNPARTPASPVPWLSLFTKAAFWALLMANYCQNNAFYILLSWMPTFFHENFPNAKSWVFNVVPWLVIVPCNITGGWLADRMVKKGYSVTAARKALSTVLFFGIAFFLALISHVETYTATLACLTFAVACCGFYSCSLAINPVDIAPQHAGAVFGIMNMTSALPGFIGVYMAGYILETTKSWAAVFNQTAAICILGWVVFLLMGTGRRII